MALFAERGFDATSVADIEVAVGLQPRRGGLYKHFANKHDLLDAAVRQHLEQASSIARDFDELDVTGMTSEPSSLRPLLVVLGRVFLQAMDDLEALTRVLEHDASRLPALTAAVKEDAVDLSYRTAARLVAAFAPRVTDPDASAVVILGSLVALRRTTWTFGTAALSMDDDRFLRTWADLTVGGLNAANER